MGTSIPKIIHLFWFGRGEKSDIINKCIDSWKKYAPDYEIKEWNEDNFDVNFCERSRQAYEQKKWAFVADIARLKVIYEQGGIYLDTDVEMKKPFDLFLEEVGGSQAFFLYHNERYIGTGYGFGAIPKAGVVGHLLNNYLGMSFENTTGLFQRVCTHIETDALEEYSSLFRRDNKSRVLEDNTIVLSTGVWMKYLYHIGTGTWVEGGRIYFAEGQNRKNFALRQFIRNPSIFRFIKKTFGHKAEALYEFLTYDFIDIGPKYYLTRLFRKLAK